MKKYTLYFFLMLLMAACGGKSQESTQTESTPSTTQEEPAASTETATEEPVLAGKGVYASYCSVCHQQDGKGVANMYPTLINQEWVGGDKVRLIKIILNGLEGEITVEGQKYNNVMTAHGFLSDKQVADVLTYVRKSFGNDYEEITEAEVAKVRAENQ